MGMSFERRVLFLALKRGYEALGASLAPMIELEGSWR